MDSTSRIGVRNALLAQLCNNSKDRQFLKLAQTWNPGARSIDYPYRRVYYRPPVMEKVPDEVVLQIISYLHTKDVVRLQSVSRRFLTLGRDNAIWKIECFTHSQAERLRRRQQQLHAQDSRLAEIRNAVSALPGGNLTAWDVAQLRGSAQPRASSDPASEARLQRTRALVNWEPGYPDEHLDYYQDFVHRHAPISIGWLDLPKAVTTDKAVFREATGAGILRHGESAGLDHLVAPLDDGSVCIWDVSTQSTTGSGGQGKLRAHSKSGLLTGQAPGDVAESHTIMTETGAVECVSIDDHNKKGYFAVQSLLHEVDLNTLQICSSRQYPWPITALSTTSNQNDLTVGTHWTIHLHDSRDSRPSVPGDAGELIGGHIYSHATLAQPGPLSILSNDDSIWVAGRFTSLLNYDRRFFPRLRGTIFSGGRIASLASLPHPWIPQSLDLIRHPSTSISAFQEARNAPGTTMLAAAEYKGKGSLEFYGLPTGGHYQNRQTASASKLLSAVPHGGRIVFSDGDGNLKWTERDGFSHVRTYNINENQPTSPPDDGTSPHGIWSSSAAHIPGQGDIVQKILPTSTTQHLASSSSSRHDIHTASSLLLWTGDGRLGQLSFGPDAPFEPDDVWLDAVAEQTTEQRARQDAERQYDMAMRRALERNADEVRFVRGLGMGYSSS
nr:hypothetical protein CFP56_54368 [Quercus suber]